MVVPVTEASDLPKRNAASLIMGSPVTETSRFCAGQEVGQGIGTGLESLAESFSICKGDLVGWYISKKIVSCPEYAWSA